MNLPETSGLFRKPEQKKEFHANRFLKIPA